tara:strand:- start:190 stop:321 length:132 start_codon:yes stop_codon:yes gene_type:complete
MDYSKLLGPKYNGNAEVAVKPEEYVEEAPVQDIPKPTRGRPRK